jgi:chromate transporter
MIDDAAGWWGLFGHFLLLSLLSIGGAITTVPDMHRYIVTEQHWLSDVQFNACIAIAQAAPGPNVLFVAVLGWTIAGAWGALVTMAGILLPSTVLSLCAARWAAQRRETLAVRSFTAGLMPLTLGLLLSTGWILAQPYLSAPNHRAAALALIVATVAALLRTKLSPMWLVGAGAIVGAMGWI